MNKSTTKSIISHAATAAIAGVIVWGATAQRQPVELQVPETTIGSSDFGLAQTNWMDLELINWNPNFDEDLVVSSSTLGDITWAQLQRNMEATFPMENQVLTWMGIDPFDHWTEEEEIEFARRSLQSLQQERFFINMFNSLDLEIPQDRIEELEEILHQIRQDLGDDENFEEAFFSIYGVEYSHVRQLEIDAIRLGMLTEHLADTIEISNEKWEETLEQIPVEHVVHVIHALVDTQEEAQSIYDQTTSWEELSALATIYSTDLGSIGRNNQPDGFYEFPRGMMVQEFEDFSFNNEAGALGIVETQFGFHIIWVITHYEDEHSQHMLDILYQQLRDDQALSLLLEMADDDETVWETIF